MLCSEIPSPIQNLRFTSHSIRRDAGKHDRNELAIGHYLFTAFFAVPGTIHTQADGQFDAP